MWLQIFAFHLNVCYLTRRDMTVNKSDTERRFISEDFRFRITDCQSGQVWRSLYKISTFTCFWLTWPTAKVLVSPAFAKPYPPPPEENTRGGTATKAKVLSGFSITWPVKNCFFHLKLTMASVFPWQLCCFSLGTKKRIILFFLSTRSASALYNEPWVFVRKRSITTGKHFLKASWQVTGDYLTQIQTDPICFTWKNATKVQKSMKIQAWTNPQFFFRQDTWRFCWEYICNVYIKLDRGMITLRLSC